MNRRLLVGIQWEIHKKKRQHNTRPEVNTTAWLSSQISLQSWYPAFQRRILGPRIGWVIQTQLGFLAHLRLALFP